MKYEGVIKRYREYLPVTDATPIVSLKEGNTPLIESKNINKFFKNKLRIFFKYEGLNPTGSFKDRGMTLAISKAKEEKAKSVICASTGNTSASAAAYSAAADLRCFVLIPKGNIAMGKLAQALVHGAKVLAIEGNFDDALNIVKEITNEYPVIMVNSLNPYRIEGQKTGAFEICDCLGETPDFHAIPVGNAGNITAYWKGYKEYKEKGKINKLPKMLGFQAEGAAPIVKNQIIKNPQTIATAIKIGNPASWKNAIAARDESGGVIDSVTDDEILSAYKMLASQEGIFVEPASAASLAGVIKLFNQGYFTRDTSHRDVSPKETVPVVVCILTGHGLKDPDRAIASSVAPANIPATKTAVLAELYNGVRS